MDVKRLFKNRFLDDILRFLPEPRLLQATPFHRAKVKQKQVFNKKVQPRAEFLLKRNNQPLTLCVV